MLRRILKSTIVLLIVGIVLNVLVAWTCAAAFKTRMFEAGGLGRLRSAEYAEQDRLAQAGIVAFGRPYYTGLFETFGTRVLHIKSGPTQAGYREQQMAGWPLPAFTADRIKDVNRPPELRGGARLGSMTLDYPVIPGFAATRGAPPTAPIPTGRPITTDHLLPLRPIWSGFAVNSMIFALSPWLLWMLWVLPMRLQRRLRGRCERCAYPIGASPVCTECGGRVRPRVAPAKLSA